MKRFTARQHFLASNQGQTSFIVKEEILSSRSTTEDASNFRQKSNGFLSYTMRVYSLRKLPILELVENH